ncbi:hypothetical protein DNTS_027372 [Danionella cerebrum]|uniref:Uncharacterized protein n=1 Tax=Danionella cerebrum TaxID=2873325 RepID=A0A553MRQ3_9TELE|nr:hypothetical protein DNTS_027372 [Danionella translucida]
MDCISKQQYDDDCFPNEPAAEIALETVHDWIKKNPDEISMCCMFLLCHDLSHLRASKKELHFHLIFYIQTILQPFFCHDEISMVS